MSNAPASTGIGAPGTDQAPADLSRSPMAASPSAPAMIPFTRGSALATMQDASGTITAGTPVQVTLQTNSFLESLLLDISGTTTGNTATVAYYADGPFSLIASITLNDPANQAIITPITGYQLYVLNKYLPDTDCFFDPTRDPNYLASTGSGGTASNGGSFSFRLVIPVEVRRRDAYGALLNSAANTRYLLTITPIASFTSTTGPAAIYSTAPTNAPAVTYAITQQYWTSPPSSITTTQGSVQVQITPPGLGSVGFVRFESHVEVSGGGSPQVQLNNVGDYIELIIFTLRNNSSPQARDQVDWPSPFQFWINDFQTQNMSLNFWQRQLARGYGYYGGVSLAPLAGALDRGVFPLFQQIGVFDKVDNYMPPSQWLATDATTKLQIRGSTFGATAGTLEVLTRNVRPNNGTALFS
jgi:hypothetical protein